jgi:hypothetical protein
MRGELEAEGHSLVWDAGLPMTLAMISLGKPRVCWYG